MISRFLLLARNKTQNATYKTVRTYIYAYIHLFGFRLFARMLWTRFATATLIRVIMWKVRGHPWLPRQIPVCSPPSTSTISQLQLGCRCCCCFSSSSYRIKKLWIKSGKRGLKRDYDAFANEWHSKHSPVSFAVVEQLEKVWSDRPSVIQRQIIATMCLMAALNVGCLTKSASTVRGDGQCHI